MKSLYDFPEIYAVLLEVTDLEFEPIAGILARHGVNPDSVLDPACGPGGWLEAFARGMGCHVAGNDIRRSMVEAARTRMPRGEWVCGDMTDLSFATGPFAAAINLSSSVGHLPDDEAVRAHLRSVNAQLAPGGVYLLEVSRPQQSRRRPRHLWTSRKCAVLAGHARVSYRSVAVDIDARTEQIAVELTTWNIDDAPRQLLETYVLRTFPKRLLRCLVEEAGFTIVAEMSNPSASDDLLMVLRKGTEPLSL